MTSILGLGIHSLIFGCLMWILCILWLSLASLVSFVFILLAKGISLIKAKRERQRLRSKLREKLGEEAVPKEKPRTIESTREHDVTMIEDDDEEVCWLISFFAYELYCFESMWGTWRCRMEFKNRLQELRAFKEYTISGDSILFTFSSFRRLLACFIGNFLSFPAVSNKNMR